MSTSYPSIALSTSWVEITAVQPTASSVELFLQNTGVNPLALFFGGDTAPADNDGMILRPSDSFQGNAPKVWARGLGQTRLAFLAL